MVVEPRWGLLLTVRRFLPVRQAFALADEHGGRLLTDDGDAQSFAKDQGVIVVGLVGVLLAAIDAGKIDEATADEWLSTRTDEVGYYVPYRTVSESR